MSAAWDFLKSDTEVAAALVAICALLTSAASLVLAAYALRSQRTHNRKSVAPFGEIALLDYENRIKVSLKNAGAGPLVVTKFRAFNGNRDLGDLISWMPDLPDGVTWTTFTGDLADRCLSPNEERVVLQLDGNPSNPTYSSFRDHVRRILSTLKVEVSYRDIYGATHSPRSRSLDWFGRLLD